MYWRAGIGFFSLWIASLTLALSAIAALAMTGSRGAALCFLTTGIVLAPPVQELIARLRHALAPAKAAFYLTITLVPIGFGILIVDAVAKLEADARKLGFASAGEQARARDLKLTTPAQFQAHLETERKAELDRICRGSIARRPIECFAPVHQKAAFAFFDSQIGHEEMAAIVRDALAQQRKTLVEADTACTALADRIDAHAQPLILQSTSTSRAIAAAAWARQFDAKELNEMVARATPGVSYLSVGTADALHKKALAVGPQIEQSLDREIQSWARRIVREEPFWNALLSGHMPATACKAAEELDR